MLCAGPIDFNLCLVIFVVLVALRGEAGAWIVFGAAISEIRTSLKDNEKEASRENDGTSLFPTIMSNTSSPNHFDVRIGAQVDERYGVVGLFRREV